MQCGQGLENATSESLSDVASPTSTQLPRAPTASTLPATASATSFFSPFQRAKSGRETEAGWTPGPTAGEWQVEGLAAATPNVLKDIEDIGRPVTTHDQFLLASSAAVSTATAMSVCGVGPPLEVPS